MPLSTSNSDNKNWVKSWLLALLLMLVSLGGYEWFLQKKGFETSVEANKDLWSWHRRMVQDNKQVIALIGASRMQLGIDTEVMREQLPNYSIVPLAINGQYPMATLKALAEDDSFKGTVLMSFMAQMLEPRYLDMQAEYNQYFAESSSFYLALDAYLTAELKSKFRFLHPLLGLSDVVIALSEYAFPQPFYISGQADSSAKGNYELTDAETLKNHFVEDKRKNYEEAPIMSIDTWEQQLSSLYQYIKAIQNRGGEVVLIRFPTDDMHWLLDEQFYPKSQFWDSLKNNYQNLQTIHFKDDEILRSFTLPDSSHLDQKDSSRFTTRLIKLLEEQGLLN